MRRPMGRALWQRWVRRLAIIGLIVVGLGLGHSLLSVKPDPKLVTGVYKWTRFEGRELKDIHLHSEEAYRLRRDEIKSQAQRQSQSCGES